MIGVVEDEDIAYNFSSFRISESPNSSAELSALVCCRSLALLTIVNVSEPVFFICGVIKPVFLG